MSKIPYICFFRPVLAFGIFLTGKRNIFAFLFKEIVVDKVPSYGIFSQIQDGYEL